MRVLVVTSIYLSGHGNFVAEQVRSLRAAKIDVDVLFFDPRRSRLYYAWSLPRIFRSIASGRYDIVHTHHTYTMLIVEAARRLARSKVPVVLTNHESEALDITGRVRTWHPTSLLRHSLWLKRCAARYADFVVFVSRRLAEIISVDRPQDIIPCGVDMAKFRPLDQRVCRRLLGLPVEDPVVFFPPHPRNMRKRFELARQAYGFVQRMHPRALLLTGGSIDADAMPIYYNAADVMVQTSYCEASPTVVKEALACEVPVVSTDVGDTAEVVAGVSYCWICSEDPREISDRILDSVGRRAVGGRDHLLRKGLSLEQVAGKLIRTYELVLNGGVPNRSMRDSAAAPTRLMG